MSQEYIEVTERTVSEAITAACQKLAVPSDRLEYEVIDPGKTGFLGIGARPAKIRVRVKKGMEESTEIDTSAIISDVLNQRKPKNPKRKKQMNLPGQKPRKNPLRTKRLPHIQKMRQQLKLLRKKRTAILLLRRMQRTVKKQKEILPERDLPEEGNIPRKTRSADTATEAEDTADSAVLTEKITARQTSKRLLPRLPKASLLPERRALSPISQMNRLQRSKSAPIPS